MCQPLLSIMAAIIFDGGALTYHADTLILAHPSILEEHTWTTDAAPEEINPDTIFCLVSGDAQ